MAANVRGIAKPSGQKAPRRVAHFWAPLNDWWRSWLSDKGRRPVTTEVQVWYNEHADAVWGDAKPSWKEARIHAKCLRSTEQVKNYFREYRARNKGGDYKDDGKFGGREGQDIKVEYEEGHPLAGLRLASGTLDHPGSPGDASAPSSSEFATEPSPYCPDKAPDPAGMLPLPTLNLGNPMTITTGNGPPPCWQQRSASFPHGARPQLANAQEQQPAWDRSRTSIVFHPPSLKLHSKKPLSPFTLTQGKKDGASDPTAALPGSPLLLMASKAQSFSCSSKRRHTNDEAFAQQPNSPSFLRHAASFSQGHSCFNNSHTPSVYGIPVDHSPNCQQQDESVLQPDQPASFYAPGAPADPASNPQTVRYPAGTSQRQSEAGCELPTTDWERTTCAQPYSHAAADEAGPPPQPETSFMGSVDRQLVDHIARDAAARSSMIEQAAGGSGRVTGRERANSAMAKPSSDAGFGTSHNMYLPALPLPLVPTPAPASDPSDASFADLWDLGEKEHSPDFDSIPSRAYQHPPEFTKPRGSNPGAVARLRAASYPTVGQYPPPAPSQAHMQGRPAAASRLDAAQLHHARPPTGKVTLIAAARTTPAHHQHLHHGVFHVQSKSHQRPGLVHPFAVGGPDSWSGKNENQLAPTAFQQQQSQQQQQQQQLGPPPGGLSNSYPSRSHDVPASCQGGDAFMRVHHEPKQQQQQQSEHLEKVDSLGLPFQSLRVHSAARAPASDQSHRGQAQGQGQGQAWTQQEWNNMEWEGRHEPGLDAALH